MTTAPFQAHVLTKPGPKKPAQVTLRDHIAARFRFGMSWERYRQWEVDHVTPLSAASTLSELIELCHYSDLQPLWRSENLRKGGA
jgi:hypothetical protein